jgi:hypothetical protein
MERCLAEYMALSPLRKILEYAKEKNNVELITEVEMMLDDEEEIIKNTYRDAIDFVVIGLLHDEQWPTADEYFQEVFAQ